MCVCEKKREKKKKNQVKRGGGRRGGGADLLSDRALDRTYIHICIVLYCIGLDVV